LARRILSYSDEVMSWECLEENFCECQTTVSQTSKSITARRVLNQPPEIPLTFGSFYHIWTSFVQEYTLRQLSLPSDRLMAIAGIVSRLQSRTDCRCLAGLWTNYVLHGLGWMVGPSSQLHHYGGFDFVLDSTCQEGKLRSFVVLGIRHRPNKDLVCDRYLRAILGPLC